MERPYTIDHFDHIVLRVSDIERAVAFYSALGGEVCIRRPTNVSLDMGGGTRVTLSLDETFQPPEVSSVDHLNFAVNTSDMRLVADYLRAQGLDAVVDEARSHSSPSVRLLDPERNVVELRLAGLDAAALQDGGLRRPSA